MTLAALHECLGKFPGAALELSSDGTVIETNGILDRVTGRDLRGVPFEEVLDTSSIDRWRQLRTLAASNPACRWELAITTPRSVEAHTFLAIQGEPPDGVTWLLEYAADPQLERIHAELALLNGELIDAQRQVARDRSRLSRALDDARSAVQRRDEVLAIVSHDLRNPLNAILSSAAILGMRIPDDVRDAQIAVIRRAAARMERLIGDLLEASAIASGELSLQSEPVAIDALVRESCRTHREKARSKRQTLEDHVAAALPHIHADYVRLEQVIGNLLDNAIKFTPDRGAIDVHASADENEIRISIHDTGPGIAERDVPHIFDRFWHVSRDRRGGTGLGLAIAKGIVNAHGGRIWVESTPGTGSAFHFTLPRTSA